MTDAAAQAGIEQNNGEAADANSTVDNGSGDTLYGAQQSAAGEGGTDTVLNDNDASNDNDTGVYEDFSFPEGMEVDSAAVGQFQAIASEFNLSQDKAQQLVDFETARIKQAEEARMAAWQETQQAWVEQGKANQEFGGDNYEESVRTALVTMEKLGTPELKEALNMSGMGNHPEMLRVFYRMGKLLEEDKAVTGRAGGGSKTAAQTLYPNQN